METTLSDIADGCKYGFVDGPFGSNLPSSCYKHKGIPVIRGCNLSIGKFRYIDQGYCFVDNIVLDKLSRSTARKFDIIFTKKGTIGQIGIIPKNALYNLYLLSSNQMRLRVDISKADPYFVYYYLTQKNIIKKIIRDSESTGVPKTNLAYFRSFPIKLPALSEQQAIAHILGTLDDKIELNRRQNATLEAMAQAIFKDWFVDFGPVHAKMEGRQPEGMSREIADLFPDRLDDEGKPEGWEWKTLDSILELCYGKALKASERIPGKTPVYGSGGITGYHNQALVITPSIIVGRKGTIGSLYIEHRPFYPIDTVFYVKSDYSIFFCYFILKQQKLKDMNTDAAVPGLNRNNVYRLVFSMPSNIVIEKFDAYIQNIYKKIYHNYSEISILISLRDTLLPKLISGELRVPDAEKMVADIV
ncbi:restriction endonuclease subunit S [Bilophila wadsworthia]|uniref:restriction endonuclease subunit S n=1 Tax=Bilophila wadsworthia TaxID=35833 RepID=UPI0026754D0C|nr:restriction endonuclease subunit S [Bilophila wadsworthia]